MDIRQAIREALDSLNANKTRAALTILGIVIGVAAVIAMLAVGSGAQDTILGSIGGIGTNLLFVFQGNPYDDKFADMDPKNWARYAGPEGGANSWEDMTIGCASEVKKVFGDFNTHESFLTKAEKLNHEDERSFSFEPSKKNSKLSTFNSNPKFIHVDNGVMNLRWLKWFMTTDYAKKDWEECFKEWNGLIEKLDTLEPQDRKDILAQYD